MFPGVEWISLQSFFWKICRLHHIYCAKTTAKRPTQKKVLDVHGLADYFLIFKIFGGKFTKNHIKRRIKTLGAVGSYTDEVIAFEDSERGSRSGSSGQVYRDYKNKDIPLMLKKPSCLLVALILTILGGYMAWGMLQVIASFYGDGRVALVVVAAVIVQLWDTRFTRQAGTKLIIDQAGEYLVAPVWRIVDCYLFNTYYHFVLGRPFGHLWLLEGYILVFFIRLWLQWSNATDIFFWGSVAIGALIIGNAPAWGIYGSTNGVILSSLIFIVPHTFKNGK